MSRFQLLAALFVLPLGACRPPLHPHEYIRPKMGTGFRILIYAASAEQADPAAEAAYARIDQLNTTLSDYDPKSELSQLSLRTQDGPIREPVRVSDDLWNILVASVDAGRRSDGAFDITIGPCVRLWRRSRELHELPTPERLSKARASVGWEAIKLFPETHSVQLLKPNMRLDVGGIAKGYAAAEAWAIIRARGLKHAMVGAAGDLACGEPPPGQQFFRVGVQSLEKADGPSEYVALRNASISTAGDTERFVIIDGVRYSHILDPKTCLGLTRRIGCSVISPSGTIADWVDDAVCILGPERGLRLVESIPGAAARVVTLDDAGKPTVYESKHWRDYKINPAAP
jgi:FAD:protein FMN transferase